MEWKGQSFRDRVRLQHEWRRKMKKPPTGSIVEMIGDESVGKKSMQVRLVQERWDPSIQFTPTTEFISWTCPISDIDTVRIQIHHASDQKNYETTMFYHWAFVIMIVFDFDNPHSLTHAEMRLNQISETRPNAFLYLIGNKCELSRKIADEDAMNLAMRYRAKYWECSAKTGYNIREMFQDIAKLRCECGVGLAWTTDEDFLDSLWESENGVIRTYPHLPSNASCRIAAPK
eukprot:TRINITY_DN8687_c1_g1_i3.p1 TRINITY_DN8687_c1_g1~~TRINITY_DN8687_c1_g1_i3.p1  ORF type:complete len:231 (+),score=48.16 TRINITY_DN8687_c1_g1_i3:300-992(+)